jgi:hypothetical protein
MKVFPELPPELRKSFPNAFWNWWQAFRVWLIELESRVSAIDGGTP